MITEYGGFIQNFQLPDDIVIAAGGEKSGYEISKAFTDNPTSVFKSTSNTVKINLTYNTSKTITGFGLINHNLTETSVIKLKYYADINFTSLIVEKTIPFNTKDTYLIIDDAPTTNYIQLEISDTSITEIKIGVIFPGYIFKCPTNFDYELTVTFCVVKDVDISDEGIAYDSPGPNDEIPEFHKFTLKFTKVSDEFFDQYKPLIRPGKKIFIPQFTEGKCYFGLIPTREINSNFQIYHNFPLEFREDAIVLALEAE